MKFVPPTSRSGLLSLWEKSKYPQNTLTAVRIARTLAKSEPDAGVGADGLARLPLLLPPPSDDLFGGIARIFKF